MSHAKHSARRPRSFRPGLEALEDRSLLSFAAAANFATGVGPYALASGHFNDDTALDLVTADLSGNAVSILLNDGNGNFAAPVSYPAGAGPTAVVAADFNGDGRDDVAVVNSGADTINILLNLGNGSFAAPTAHATGDYPISLTAGDFNGDGANDIAVANHYGHSVSVLLNNDDGTGTFRPGGTTATNVYPESVVTGDFTDDDVPDLVTGSASSGISTLVGNGDGTFDPPPIPVYVDPMSLAVGDLNEDGTLDLVGTASVTYTYGGGGGGYGGYGGYGYWGGWSYSSVTYGLVNVLIGNGDGTFNYQTTYYLPGADPSDVAVADFNNDGWLDVAAAQRDYGVTVLLGQGDGSLRWYADLSVGSGPSGLIAEDLNGDQLPDLAVSNQYSSNVSVLANVNDWQPWLTVLGGGYVLEGHTGTTPVTFTVRLSPGATGPVTVDFATADDTATAGSDYDAVSGTLTFTPDGPREQTVTVNVRGDTVIEDYEAFRLVLSNASGAGLYAHWGYGTIQDDEPYASIEYAEVVEGDTGTTELRFTVRLSAPSPGEVTVGYATADGDALAGSDYVAETGTVTFAPNQTEQTITIDVIGDTAGEWDEWMLVYLTGVDGARVGYSQAYGTIHDNEPRISVSGASVTEGNSGTTQITFTVTRSGSTAGTVSVTYATANGNAVAGKDYTAATNTLTFGPGDTSISFTVTVLADTMDEYDEYFYLNLTNATGALIEVGQAVGRILDDDAAPTLLIADASVTEGHKNSRTMTFTLTLSAPSDKGVYVLFTTADGTAKSSGNDYVYNSNWVYFAPGQTTATLSVSIKGDRNKEGNETFFVNLSNCDNAVIEDAQAIGTILDDDRR